MPLPFGARSPVVAAGATVLSAALALPDWQARVATETAAASAARRDGAALAVEKAIAVSARSDFRFEPGSDAQEHDAWLPYTAQGHGLVAPTATPTPPPSPTPLPGFDRLCRANRSMDFCSWLSTGEPAGGDEITAFARLYVDGRPAESVEMKVRWSFPYPTVFKHCSATSGADGVAACTVAVPDHARGDAGAAYIQMAHLGVSNQRQIGFAIR